MAIDLHIPLFCRCRVFLAPWFTSASHVEWERHRHTCSLSSQSKPVWQRSCPVTRWWKPWLVLTFLKRGGFNAEPLSVIQSNTMPFSPLVSSDLALNMPFWIFDEWEAGSESLRWKNIWAWPSLQYHMALPLWGALVGRKQCNKVYRILDVPFWPCVWK